ncbi:gamma-glutamyltransferase family protein [Sphingomonas canadensis]|uniref:Gamma-glutamyltransferase family protein n=1 Tax=Sphingomonas canadensis TaxID=1219257 RepID=A0ABW3HAA2_9SPHN|nr:gamma-glutamyltransferase [Sphingomonas canadensis]MCW3837398.1 gamma-glutamyltransferase [Sphingomonas canadensis]
MTLSTVHGRRGMVTAPHHLASEAGLAVLKDGGTAAEAAVAVAACLAVVYPHMTGIGGDSFWLVREPDGRVHAVHGCGAAAGAATLERYGRLGAVPARGPLAANTVAGTVSAWEAMLAGGTLPLERILRDAIGHAAAGVPVTWSGADTLAAKGAELRAQPGAWAATYDGMGEGDILRQPALGDTLRALAREGLASFYTGSIAERIAEDFAALDGLVTAEDLAAHRAERPVPLTAAITGARLWNSAPPTQGGSSLLILALYDRIAAEVPDGFDHVHRLVEATKQAFLRRERDIDDPAFSAADPQATLDDAQLLTQLANAIEPDCALRWPQPPSAGDTCWFAVADAEGCVVSAIQSVYFEFGSGVTLPRTGITWQNRGSSFRLAESGWNALKPGRRPFHTLNPALAEFADGRVLAYGTMGGEGQPQTQAAVFTRHARYGIGLQEAISAPRWLLGRTWGETSTTLKIEKGFAPEVYRLLRAAGHEVEVLPLHAQAMGHAGAIVRHPDGALEGATDPRSDGRVAAW